MLQIKSKPFIIVFSKIQYILLAFSITIIYLLLAVMMPSISIIKFFWGTEFPVFKLVKLSVDFFLYNSATSTIILTLIISVLSGVNISMLVFYLRRRIAKEKEMGVGFVGMIFGFLGLGCASCGSVILSSILGLTAANGFLRIMPFNGLEFGILGVVLLIVSIYLLSVKIENPLLCKIKARKY